MEVTATLTADKSGCRKCEICGSAPIRSSILGFQKPQRCERRAVCANLPCFRSHCNRAFSRTTTLHHERRTGASPGKSYQRNPANQAIALHSFAAITRRFGSGATSFPPRRQKIALARLNFVHEVPRQHQKIIGVRSRLCFGDDRYPRPHRILPPFFRVAFRRRPNHGVI